MNSLIKSGSIDSALQLFESMPVRDAVSFNLVIASYARHGFSQRSFGLFREMISQGIKENPSTFSSVLGICNNAGFHREGFQVHCRAILLGFDSNLFVGSALVDLYMRSGHPNLSLKLFDELPERNLATWNVALRGLCELGYSDALMDYFSRMQLDEVEANAVTFSYLIRGCSNGQFLPQGEQFHSHVIKMGWVPSNLFVANALVDFYAECGSLIDARKSIEFIPAEDVISWNSIISVHAINGFSLEALEFFDQMQSWGKKPSIRSFLAFLNLASETQNINFGKQIHCFVLKQGFDQGSIHVQSALIDMYGKCGQIESSVSVFDEIHERNLECCNSLMTSLLHCGITEDVIELFGLMVDEEVGLDYVTFSTTLKALSSSASTSFLSCRVVHCCVIKSGFESDIVVSSSLIDAYSRSGHIKESQQIFERILDPNIICFTSIITGYARNGMGREVLEMLEALIERCLQPDAITFLSVLAGCSHSGLVEEGLSVFESMKTVHGIHPDRRHYSCMVDLLGRVGRLVEAEQLLKFATLKGDSKMWSSLLRSCRVHRNEEVGRRAAKALIELEPDDHAAYLQASGFYSEIGDSEASMKIREIKANWNMRKECGYSLIEIMAHGVAENVGPDDMVMLGELEENLNFEVEDEMEEVEFLEMPVWKSERGAKVLINVDGFGAVGDGISDDTQAFVSAWDQACSTSKSVLLVPEGRRYLVNATKFKGPCAGKLIVQIDGTIVAPNEPNNWDKQNPRIWLDFSKLQKVSFQGDGVIDGSGGKWWDSSCKRNKSNALTIDSSSGVRVKGLTIQNAQQMHFVISHCDSVRVVNVKVSAPGTSPNTDGIHITKSTNVGLENCKIGTGDDCISIVNGSSGIKMKNIYCGPGHGISIGSLGKDNSSGIVTKVVVDTAFLKGTTNGLRIKTWQQGGSGYVRAVRFLNVRMDDVANPIIIDQFYCDSPKSCKNQTSAVEISQVVYRNISGTTKSANAIKFACSDTVPCKDIVLNNVNLESEDGTAETYCNSATGFHYGVVHPSADCLVSDKILDTLLIKPDNNDPIHTEL
ncbi:Glycoside hydrolase [Macleaya cordata]|uniref:endo-polygalacturonase n=1 Tax=Macleaya cordata TaxID=56857 RepID=A0A200R2P8_MACCD|nr:Glycoside hydrolase [Macleaya cordata]